MTDTLDTNFNLLDFGIIGEQLSVGELLHTSYMRGREDVFNDLKRDFKNNLQSAAQSSSLLKSKLKECDIDVKEMYLKVVDVETFKCLVVLDSNHFYIKEKRRESYSMSQQINDTNNMIELDFSIMSFSKDIEVDNITSDGFVFKYVTTNE